MDWHRILLFIPTFAAASLTPGMCMTLSMSLGIAVGVRRTLWMMAGELLGVATVTLAAVAGVATLMLNFPLIFRLLCVFGGAYLVWLGVHQWRASAQATAIASLGSSAQNFTPLQLFSQGYVTAVSNPKGWAFMVALLPPFINQSYPVLPQLAVLLGLIIVIEFSSLLLYASGGRELSRWLQKSDKAHWLPRLSASLLVLIGVWLMWQARH